MADGSKPTTAEIIAALREQARNDLAHSHVRVAVQTFTVAKPPRKTAAKPSGTKPPKSARPKPAKVAAGTSDTARRRDSRPAKVG